MVASSFSLIVKVLIKITSPKPLINTRCVAAPLRSLREISDDGSVMNSTTQSLIRSSNPNAPA
jgi:hypothetical protein